MILKQIIFPIYYYFVFRFIFYISIYSRKITVETPLYIAILMIPLMIFGGGMEEPGWRGLLESELKEVSFSFRWYYNFGFWSIWHFPLY